MNDWYYAKDGDAVGPVTFSDLEQMARRGQLRREHVVWTDGMAGWEPASPIEQLWPKQPPPLPARLMPTKAAPQARETAAPTARDADPEGFKHIGVRRVEVADNWMVRHWQGELPFWKSFWLIGMLLGLVSNAIVTAIGTGLVKTGVPYSTRAAVIWGLLPVSLGFAIWQIVGIWRSAGVYASNRTLGRVSLAMLARVLMVIGCLQAIVAAGYVIAMLT